MANKWKALNSKNLTEKAVKKYKKNYFLEFKTKGLNLQLEVNDCHSSCEYKGGNYIELPVSSMGCSRMCCDSKEGLELMQNLQGNIQFEIKGEHLYLKTTNKEIIFSRSK